MADEYGFSNTEEEFKALLDQLVDKVLDKQTQQTSARQALSEIIGIDLDKVEKLINGGHDNTVAELARSANGNVTIIHFG